LSSFNLFKDCLITKPTLRKTFLKPLPIELYSRLESAQKTKMKYFALLAVLLALGFSAEAACPTDENGVVLESFSIDGCNTCSCNNGLPACTRMLCGPRCKMNYYPDICNTCVCNQRTGMAGCTYAFCPSWFE